MGRKRTYDFENILDQYDLDSKNELFNYIRKNSKNGKINLFDADLSRAILNNIDLSYADLSGTNLSGTNFTNANLANADLSCADLFAANFKNADLSYAIFCRADLTYADLSGANLKHANFKNADLYGTNLNNTNLNNTIIDGLRIKNIAYKQKIIAFIIKNGWEKGEDNDEYESFFKENNIRIDISDNLIVLIGDIGNFLYFEIDHMTIYTLLGFLLQNRYISLDYKF